MADSKPKNSFHPKTKIFFFVVGLFEEEKNIVFFKEKKVFLKKKRILNLIVNTQSKQFALTES